MNCVFIDIKLNVEVNIFSCKRGSMLNVYTLVTKVVDTGSSNIYSLCSPVQNASCSRAHFIGRRIYKLTKFCKYSLAITWCRTDTNIFSAIFKTFVIGWFIIRLPCVWWKYDLATDRAEKRRIKLASRRCTEATPGFFFRGGGKDKKIPKS